MSVKFQNLFNKERYAECDLCGEGYWGYDIEIYMNDVVTRDESFLFCHEHVREASRKAKDTSLLTSTEIVRLVNALRREDD